MGLFDKLKDKVQSSSSSSTDTQASFSSVPTVPLGPDSIYRYRKQRGVNLGSWFVLEKWLTPRPFANAVDESDLGIAKGKGGKEAFEHHWNTFITDDDWKFLKEHGFNSVRLPIAYYHLGPVCPAALKDTEFERYADVFSGAWERIERAVQTAASYGLGVLIDLHCASGCQNADDHSGTSNGKARLFDKSANLRSTSAALQFLATHFAKLPHVVGLELLNEPERGNMKLQGWYEKTIQQLQSLVGPHFPLYVSDAWDLQHYAHWVGHQRGFIVVDHHLYSYIRGPESNVDGDGAARAVRERFSHEFGELSNAAKGNVVVGEWAGALRWDIIGHLPAPERDQQHRVWVQAQLELFERSTAGYWFWCLKKAEEWDAGWSAKDEVRAEILPKWVGTGRFKGNPPQDVKDQALKQGHDSHTGYWAANGGSPNPAVYAPGFSQGWDDALIFFTQPDGSSEMGFVSQWASRRKEEFESAQGSLGPAAWEWEHGFSQGVEACKAACMG